MANVGIVITRLEVDGYEIPVPHGLSELLDRCGAWSTEKPKLEGYECETFIEDGKLITRVTKIKKKGVKK